MSEYSYTKSITTDFGGSINTTYLQNEIIAETSITSTLKRIDRVGDAIYIVFDTELSGAEQTLLTTVISNHNSSVVESYSIVSNISLKDYEIKTNTYKRFGTFVYPGKNNTQNIIKICAVAFIDLNQTSFSIRIDDKTNDLTIAENTFTNTTETLLDLGTISNVPDEQAIIEVCVKKDGVGGGKGYLDSVTFYYE